MFALADIIHGHQCVESFDARLRARLGQPASQQEQIDDDLCFDPVRALFRNAAIAMKSELKHGDVYQDKDNNILVSHCHWVPGRVEVMGKHTDYAGGNSLVCATAGRGMAMVSTFVSNDDMHTDSGMKVTIVSVLPKGMEHHATRTAAPYQVEGKLVVHHTINIPYNKDGASSKINKAPDTNHPEINAVDWTIYPVAVINRLHQNFCLFPHEANNTGHIYVAISSNLPPASGLSTSSAFVTGLFLVLDKHLRLSATNAYRNAIGEDDADSTVCNLSTYLGNVENGRDYINGSVVLKGTVQGGVGTFGGSEDHAAILMGRRSELRLLSFCPTRPFSGDAIISLDTIDGKTELNTRHEESVVHLSQDLTFVIAYSGAKAEKAGGTNGATEASIGYNSASDLARKAFDAYFAGGDGDDGLQGTQTLADVIRKRLGTASASNDQSIKANMARRIKSHASSTDQTEFAAGEEYSAALVERFEQFYQESEHLVPAAAHAISKEKYDMLGPIVDASHRGAVNLLKNQIAETAWLPLWARGMENDLQTNPLRVGNPNSQHTKHEYKSVDAKDQPKRIKALAASAFGAGFGGSCWALVYRNQAEEFAKQWGNAYDERFPAKESIMREFFLVDPGPGAFCV